MRTHTLGTLRKENVGEMVKLSGWVHRRRDHGGLIFIDLRDRFGITQLVFDPKISIDMHTLAEKLRSEWVIHAQGKVTARKEGLENIGLATGAIEVQVYELEILSKAKTPPFSIADDTVDVHEEHRLKYRYLDLRRGKIANNLVLRHKTMLSIRNYMDQNGFLEISTPILAKSTPEGARDYLVPSRIHPGSFYALPQSPQIFKQLLMVGGMDRYFQIAPCFRDEDLRADRQPEFTQIDIEMSFEKRETLFNVIEGLLKRIFKEILDLDIPTPFIHMTHQECIDKYGTDKPDLRFGMPLHDIQAIAEKSDFSVFKEQIQGGGIVKALCVKGGSDISRKGIEEYTSFVNRFGIQGLAWMKVQIDGRLNSNIVKFFPIECQNELIEKTGAKADDLIFMLADTKERVNQAFDHLRRKLARDRSLIVPSQYAFLWVVDFPLFAWNREEGRLESEHHPFTSPLFEDIPLIDIEPLKVRSSSYDLVLNGYELASGSQRVHDPELQEKIFQVLNLTKEAIKERFGFFVEALSYGTPPHLGAALGLDRLVMILTQTDNIRDVIAFPKTQKASDLMLECPSAVSDKQLQELSLQVDAIK